MGSEREGRAALVTGASRGIGKEIALELARNGWRVAVNYYNDPAPMAEATLAGIRALGVDALAVEADIRSPAQVAALFAQVVARFGRLDLLVNNAGVQTFKPLLEVTEEEWDLVIDTNLKGCFLCTQAAGRHMKDHGGGVIVNLGSGCNKLAFPRLVAYTASKGAIESERTRQEDPDYAGTWATLTPMARVGVFGDIAPAVVFLASPGASFISGQTIGIDGGLFIRAPWPYQV
jgi:NAD(P)-dependent dehydrogenase (short-subunit alcohol dehydrogenase family)